MSSKPQSGRDSKIATNISRPKSKQRRSSNRTQPMGNHSTEILRTPGYHNDSWSKVEEELQYIIKYGTCDFLEKKQVVYLVSLCRDIEVSERAMGRIAHGVDRTLVMMRQLSRLAVYFSNPILSAAASGLIRLARKVIPSQTLSMEVLEGEGTNVANGKPRTPSTHHGGFPRRMVEDEGKPLIRGKVESFLNRIGNVLVTHHPEGHRSVDALDDDRRKPDRINPKPRKNKKVEFSSKKQCIDENGVVMEEAVEDNEGKTLGMKRNRRAKKPAFSDHVVYH